MFKKKQNILYIKVYINIYLNCVDNVLLRVSAYDLWQCGKILRLLNNMFIHLKISYNSV